jgi:hypothetical protein
MLRAIRPGWRLLLLPLAPYLLSFVLPFKTPGSVDFGFVIFQTQLHALCHLLAWSKTVGDLMAAMTWCANPLFWFGYFAMMRGRYAVGIILGLCATVLALVPPIFAYISGTNEFPTMPYCWWAWLASMILLTIAAELAYDLSPERAELERQWAQDRAK